MAAIKDLLLQIPDLALRSRLEQEFARLSKNKKFGLVFEEHIPECTPLYGVAIKRGSTVSRKSGQIGELYTVVKLTDDMTACRNKKTGIIEEIPATELVAIARFGEPIFPALKPIDFVENAPENSLWHTLIEADNYHALQLLEYLYPKQVDCIYIDPPYNTGARDWKYNNDYVDSSDIWRHSKWLSMMQRRLSIAKQLLNPANSTLIVTIDEHEYIHLGMLLEEMFPEARMQMVSSVINPAGAGRQTEFSRTDEYIYFLQFGSSVLLPESREEENTPVIWDTLRRSSLANARGKHGKGACGPNQFYPIYVDNSTGRISQIGDPIPETADRNTAPQIQGCTAVFPVRPNGIEMNWGIKPEEAKQRLANGYLRAGKHSPDAPQQYAISYVTGGNIEDINLGIAVIVGHQDDGSVIAHYPEGRDKMPTTNWNRPTHDAQRYGTNILTSIIGGRFQYPKSLYAVKDALRFFLQEKPDALVVDFFAGSGTTLHAVNLMNAEDGGHRRCIIVTNNEVSNEDTKKLSSRGFFPGDDEWEKYGIARYITWPRTQCSVLGIDINGDSLKGTYLATEAPMADGFKTNVEYFKLGFLEKNAVSLGHQFCELLPLLWLKAGAIGKRPRLVDEEELPYLILPQNGFAILVDETKFSEFLERLLEELGIPTVYFVTNSEEAFREMSEEIKVEHTYQLYRDYVDNFVLGVRRSSL